MRARNIKPDFFKSEGLSLCSPMARLLFIGLWCMADRAGRLEDRPLRIKAELFPYGEADVDSLLNELADREDCDGTPSFILRYGEKKRYIQVMNFSKHQHPHIKEAESTIPAPDKHQTSTVQEPENNHSSPADSLILIPETFIPISASRFDEFYSEYPRHEGKADAEKAWKKIKSAEVDIVMAGMRRYKQACDGKEKQYIKTPAAWLNGRRWEDESNAPAVLPAKTITKEQAAAMDKFEYIKLMNDGWKVAT